MVQRAGRCALERPAGITEPGYVPYGSLDLYVQHNSPGAAKEADWLPAPKGPFNLTMCLYAPKNEIVTGTWNPPPVTKDQGPLALQAQ